MSITSRTPNKGRRHRDEAYFLMVLREIPLAELAPVYKSKGPNGKVLNRTRITIPKKRVVTETQTTKGTQPIRAGSRWAILNRDGFRCYYCGRNSKDGANLHIDHVVPFARGGIDDIDNLVTTCEQCNLGKSTSRCYNEKEVLLEVAHRNKVAGLL